MAATAIANLLARELGQRGAHDVAVEAFWPRLKHRADAERLYHANSRGSCLYVLQLQDNRLYVGLTDDWQSRIKEHSGQEQRTSIPGSAWTKKWPPISTEPSDHWLFQAPPGYLFVADHEQHMTRTLLHELHMLQLVDAFMYVRGGLEVGEDRARKQSILQDFRRLEGACFRCLEHGHFARNCPNTRWPPAPLPDADEPSSGPSSPHAGPGQAAAAAAAGPEAHIDRQEVWHNLVTKLCDQDKLHVRYMVRETVKAVSPDGAATADASSSLEHLRPQLRQHGLLWVADLVMHMLGVPCIQQTQQQQQQEPVHLRAQQLRVLQEIQRALQHRQQQQAAGLQPMPSHAPGSNSQPPPAPQLRDLVVVSSTGSGKTLAMILYLAAAIIHGAHSDGAGGINPQRTALMLVPTQAVLNNVAFSLADACRAATGLGGECYEHSLPGGMTRPLGGKLPLRNGDDCVHQLQWSVWQGVGKGTLYDYHLARHTSSTLGTVNLIIATPDIVQYHLTNMDKMTFLTGLHAVAIDEMHEQTGSWGANTSAFLQVLCQACRYHQQGRTPSFILASATAPEAENVAQRLLGPVIDADGQLQERSVTVIEDGMAKTFEVIYGHAGHAATSDELMTILSQQLEEFAAQRARGRVVLYLSGNITERLAVELVSPLVLGEHQRALLFSSSKAMSRHMNVRANGQILQAHSGRISEVYDADCDPKERRRMEAAWSKSKADGRTIIATVALRVGADIRGLDVGIIPSLQADRIGMEQLKGRIGRQPGEPGLVLVGVSERQPHGELLLRDPVRYLEAPNRRQQLPLELPSVAARLLGAACAYAQKAGCIGSAWASWLEEIRLRIKNCCGEANLQLLREEMAAVRSDWHADPATAGVALRAACQRLHLFMTITVADGAAAMLPDDFYRLGYRSGCLLPSVPLVICNARGDGRPVPDMAGKAVRHAGVLSALRTLDLAFPGASYLSANRCRYEVVDVEVSPPGREDDIKAVQASIHVQRLRYTPRGMVEGDVRYNPDDVCTACEAATGEAIANKDCKLHVPHPVTPGHDCELCDAEQCPVGVRACPNGNWLPHLSKIWVMKRKRDEDRRSILISKYHAPEGADQRPLPQPVMLQTPPGQEHGAPLPNRGLLYGLWRKEVQWAGYAIMQGKTKVMEVSVEEVADNYRLENRNKLCQHSHGIVPYGIICDRPFFMPVNIRVEGFSWCVPVVDLNGDALRSNYEDILAAVGFILASRLAAMLETDRDGFEVSIDILSAGSHVLGSRVPDDAQVEVRVLEGNSMTGSGAVLQALRLGGLFVSQGPGSIAWPADVMAGYRTSAEVVGQIKLATTAQQAAALQPLQEGEEHRAECSSVLRSLQSAWHAGLPPHSMD